MPPAVVRYNKIANPSALSQIPLHGWVSWVYYGKWTTKTHYHLVTHNPSLKPPYINIDGKPESRDSLTEPNVSTVILLESLFQRTHAELI
jgi:hypothetical protein